MYLIWYIQHSDCQGCEPLLLYHCDELRTLFRVHACLLAIRLKQHCRRGYDILVHDAAFPLILRI
jgi:hypothetical protein